MLPFLKNREGAAASGPVETIERSPDDEGGEYGMLDAVADDLLAAIEKKDKALLKEALAALVEHIQAEDVAQDAAAPV